LGQRADKEGSSFFTSIFFVVKDEDQTVSSLDNGIWDDISRDRATTGCVHICCFKNIEKAGK
jgi:hypothetical protein